MSIDKLYEAIDNPKIKKGVVAVTAFSLAIIAMLGIDARFISSGEHKAFEEKIISAKENISKIELAQEKSHNAARASILLNREHLESYLDQLLDHREILIAQHGVNDSKVTRIDREIDTITQAIISARGLLYDL